MNEIVLFIGLLLNQNMTVTSYRSIQAQTDSSPNYTSIGDRTHKGGCAVSRDLLTRWKGPVNYGDYLYIEGMGIYQVNDVMGDTGYDKDTHKRFKIREHIDIWVASHDEEKKIGIQHHRVFLIKGTK
jgi:hypothetical protein